ncbi:tetratricopeptide repeat protein, partial [Streptomyces sp. NPDC058394]|uniref:tetratricopeptide repeat protein n=1 Tax=Streptomyces sp. NPDC058394 TaxID=3346477 RepID=UPI003669001A
MSETARPTPSSPETHVIDYRAAEQLLAARDPRGAVKLLDSVIAAHPENTAALTDLARRLVRTTFGGHATEPQPLAAGAWS